MRERATALTEQTKGALPGVVETNPMGGAKLAISLSVQVPALNDYKYRLLTYTQPIGLYPGWLEYSLANTATPIDDEKGFVAELKAILSSPEINNLIAGLLVQAEAA